MTTPEPKSNLSCDTIRCSGLLAPQRSIPLFSSLATAGLSMAVVGILGMAMPWTLLTHGISPMWVGIVGFLIQIPVAIGMYAGGFFSERHGARRVLLVSDTTAALLAVVASGIAFVFPDVTLIPIAGVVAMLALSNFCGAPGSIVQDSSVPELARLARMPLARANGLRDIAINLGMIGGPASGVLLVDIVGLKGALAVATGLLAVITVIDGLCFPSLRLRTRAADAVPIRPFHRLVSDKLLLAVTIIGVALLSVFFSLDEVLAPVLVLEQNLDAESLSLFLLLTAAASLTGAAGFTVFGPRLPKALVMRCGLIMVSAGLISLALFPLRDVLIATPILIGLGTGPLWPIVITAIHLRLPTAERAPVIGALASIVLLAPPVAALCSGPAIALFGSDAVVWSLAALAGSVAIASFTLFDLSALDKRRS